MQDNSSIARDKAIQSIAAVTLTPEDAQMIMECVRYASHPVLPEQPDMNQVNRAQGSNAPMGIGEAVDKKVGPYLTGTSQARNYTRADMHEKAAASEQLSAQRNASAAAFLRSYPQFETFLDLIKDGAITLY